MEQAINAISAYLQTRNDPLGPGGETPPRVQTLSAANVSSPPPPSPLSLSHSRIGLWDVCTAHSASDAEQRSHRRAGDGVE